ncbi:MAG: FAD-dependent oxidoreductase [Planctomycetota bacterium]
MTASDPTVGVGLSPGMRAPRVVIAGAGCAGLAAGLALQKRGFSTLIVERSDRVGGLAGGIEIEGNCYEYGPHIFHTTDPEILSDVKAICKEVLEPFERTIKIKFGSKYFDYPLSPLDILTKLPPLTVLHAVGSLAVNFTRGLFRRGRPFANSEEALLQAYGSVLYRIFFRDYIYKVWGIGPESFSPSFATQRLPSFSPKAKLLALWHKVFPAPAKAISTEGYVENVEGEYFTTRRGFSLICEAFAAEYQRAGGELRLSTTLQRVEFDGGRCTGVTLRSADGEAREACDWFASTIPLSLLPTLFHPPAPVALAEAAGALQFRAIVFVGILVRRATVLPASFMYFRDKTFNRITDLSLFKVEVDPPGSTILVAEITCQPGERLWTDEDHASACVVDELVADGILAHGDVTSTHVFKAEHGYPIYRVGYEERLATALREVAALQNVSSIGRQGRFAYINTHVAMKMGYDLARDLASRFGDTAAKPHGGQAPPAR